MKKLQIVSLMFGLSLFVACGSSNSDEHNEAEHETEASEASHDHEDAESAIAKMMVAPEGARVFFVNLEDGAVVTSPLKVEMGSEVVKIEPAGEIVEGTGHHHIIINGGPTAFGTVVGADATHIHYGLGQEETELELTPGKYTLTLQFADGFHRSYGETISSTITIEVQ